MLRFLQKAMLVAVCGALVAWGQDLDRVPAELVDYPDLIVYNGKIITVDDHSFTSQLGTIAAAMAVRDDRILAIGSNDAVRRLAGPNTKVIDLKGRTVLPGIISPHDHPYDWFYKHAQTFLSVIRDDSVIVARFPKGTPQEQLQGFDATVKEAVQKARPGQFIFIQLNRGEYDQWGREVSRLLGREITRQRLDNLAPNNPVIINGLASLLMNTKTFEAYQKVYPNWETYTVSEKNNLPQLRERGIAGAFIQRRILNDVMWGNRTDVLGELNKVEMSWWAGYGVTTVGTSIEGFNAVEALSRLERKEGRLPLRVAWAYSGPLFDEPYFLRSMVALTGRGSDYFWLIGTLPETVIKSCSTAPASPEVKAQEVCVLAPGMPARQKLYEVVKAGWRIASLHTEGDKDIGYYLDTIEEASRDAGFTPEQVRAKRHVLDHCWIAPRPDQILRIKQLGLIVSCNNNYLYENAPRMIQIYGEQVASWMVPRKGLVDNGVMTVMELDKPLGHTVFTAFHYLELGVTRRAKDGKVYAPEQRVDRQTMLKIATTWGSYYLLKEDKIGSLEPGKLADFIVLDRDYLTIPEEQISEIQVLLTVVGGKPTHLVPSLASEIGWEPTGAQVKLGHVR